MPSTPATLVFPPVTGQIVQRLGIDPSTYIVEESKNPDFPTATVQDHEWDNSIRGHPCTADELQALAVGDIVRFWCEGKGNGNPRKELELGRICAKEAPTEADEPAGKRRKIDQAVTAGQPTILLERLGKLCDVLGPVARHNELYSTGKTMEVALTSITMKVRPTSCRLRLVHDERRTVWEIGRQSQETALDAVKETGDSYKSKTKTWSHEGREIHEFDVLQLQRIDSGARQGKRENIFAQVTQIQACAQGDRLDVHMAVLDVQCDHHSSERAFPVATINKGKPFRFDRAQWEVLSEVVVLSASTAVGKRIAHLLPGRQQMLRVREGNTTTAFQTCLRCEESVCKSAEAAQAALQEELKALCIFSGAGGEIAGFNMDGFVKPICAIDMDHLCGLTTKTIDPEVTCLAEDIALLVKKIIRGAPLPAGLPRPTDVQIVTLSPPCQGFSGANYRRSGSDPRNMLVAVGLAMVEVYQPSYVLLENVLGMLESSMKMGNESSGAVKLIVGTLLELGYSVKMTIIEAASFGSPSNRRRALFLASRDRPLPHLPPPTHACSRPIAATTTISPREGVKLRYTTSDSHGDPLFPLPLARSVHDAISDLPNWDWKDPHSLYGEFSRLDEIKGRRQEHGIRAYNTALRENETSAWRRRATGPSAAFYSSPVQNSFQRLMRSRSSQNTPLLQHQTYRPSALIAERATNIPFGRGDSCEDVGSALTNKRLLLNNRHEEAFRMDPNRNIKNFRAPRGRKMQRMDDDVPCDTLLTSICLSGKMGASIHPYDARVLSVREMARLQGFPDHVTFGGAAYERLEGMDARNAYKQIGNALPPLVARAVGRAIAGSHVEWRCKSRSLDKGKARAR